MKQVLAHAGPFDFAALRYLIGAAILFAALMLSRQSLLPPPLRRDIFVCRDFQVPISELWPEMPSFG